MWIEEKAKIASFDVEKLQAAVANAHLEVKIYKTCKVPSTFSSSDVEKLHATLAKSTFGSKNIQNISW